MSDEDQMLQALLEKAEKGDIEAQYEIGWRSAIGIGLNQDEALALEWLITAARNGHSLAQNNLGARYLAGEGVPNDPVEAYYWFYQAAQKGDRKAGKNVDTVAGMLRAEQLEQVKKRLGLT
ncbi:MAG: tetratricopeptide repeat protein [Verrucomicrobiales bacterium]